MRAALMAELQQREISARIKQARNEAGLTQEEIAGLLNVKARAYQNYESTEHGRVPWRLMGKIAEVTGRTEQWLLHGDDVTPTDEVLSRLDQLERMLRERAELERTLERKLDLLLSNLNAAEPVSDLLDDMETRQPGTEAVPRTKRKRRR